VNNYNIENLINTFISYDPTESKKRKAEDDEIRAATESLFSLQTAVCNPTKKKARLTKRDFVPAIYNELKADPLCMMTTPQANLAGRLGVSSGSISKTLREVLGAKKGDGSVYPQRFFNSCQKVVKKYNNDNNFISKIIVFRTVEVIEKIARAIFISFYDALKLEEDVIEIPKPFKLKTTPQGVDDILESMPPITKTFSKKNMELFRVIYNDGACEDSLKMSADQLFKENGDKFSKTMLSRAPRRLFKGGGNKGGIWPARKLAQFESLAKKHRANGNIISPIIAEYYESMRQDIIAIYQTRLEEVLDLTKDDQRRSETL